MDILQEIEKLHLDGLTTKDIALKLNANYHKIKDLKTTLKLPKLIDVWKEQLNNKIIEFHKLNLTDRQMGEKLNLNHRTISYHRKRLNLPASMPEINYVSNSDRIKGYMIRNSKFMSKRRGIDFNLKYTDFELPEYCPILNTKLSFNKESCGNDPSHASLDRIDNTKGYIPGNVIVMSRLANAMKNSANFEQLELFSKNIMLLINNYKIQDALGSITDIFPNCGNLDSTPSRCTFKKISLQA